MTQVMTQVLSAKTAPRKYCSNWVLRTSRRMPGAQAGEVGRVAERQLGLTWEELEIPF